MSVRGCTAGLLIVMAACALPGCSSNGGNGLAVWKRDPKPSNKLLMAYGRLKESEGDYEEARGTYDRVLLDHPKSVEAMIGVARLDHLAGRHEAAEQRLLQALKLDPKSLAALLTLGQIYTDRGRKDEAIARLTEVAQLAPNNPQAHYHLALALAKFGDVDNAVARLKPLVGSAVAHYNVGVVLHERGDLVGAEKQFQQALVESPKNAPAAQRLALVQRDLNTQRETVRRSAIADAISNPTPVGSVTPAAATAKIGVERTD